jgi:hypothetical protein
MRLGPARRQVAHDAVRDLEHAADLVERLGRRAEGQQVIDAFRLVVDLVCEPSPAPRVVGLPGPALLGDELLRARQNLALALLGELGVEHEQNLVVVHVPVQLLPLDLGGPAVRTGPGTADARRGEKSGHCSIGLE